MEPTLDLIESLARQAGEILRLGQKNGFKVSHKGEIDLVTEMDHRSEAFLLAEINREFPGHTIMAEETGTVDGDCDCLWLIDPLDGTVNYAHGIPLFAVSIGYQENGVLKYGVVYDPMYDECFTAERGKGAWLNGRRLQLSAEPVLDQSLLVTGFPYDIRTNPVNNLDNYVKFSLRSQGVRRLGSAALDLCYVAAGRFDGFWEIRLHPYDVAGGGLVAEEAGAVVTDIYGAPDYLDPHNGILAAPKRLHAQMLQVLEAEVAP